jgi:glycosyltransferase involved in cell wall biosynthesis
VPVPDPVAAPPVVSILCSLYCGGRHIDSYLANLTAQEGFRNHELIVVDACSPEGEGLVVKEYARSFPGIVYRRERTRVGIYEAWNTALRLARGRYVTNANLDDSRRPDSLAVMARALDALPGVDVVYSDVFYTLVPHLPWETVAAIDVRTDLPPLTTWNLLEFNSPHCAPMWRRALHDRFGGFDASFSSAGDWEFWLRCAERGALFHKLPEPLVAYTFNLEGISTRRGTAGVREQWPIRERYRELLVQPERGLDPLRPMSPNVPAGGPRGETTP